MVLKRSGLGLEKIGGLCLVTWWSCYITGPTIHMMHDAYAF